MAKARGSVPDPPAAESEEDSREEEEESTEDENEGSSESESEPETEPPQTQNSQATKNPSSTPAPAAKRPELPAAGSSSSDEDDSSSESDGAPAKKPDPNIKPIASKPMDSPQKNTTTTKKPRSKPSTSGPISPVKSTPAAAGAKRSAAEATGGGDGDAKEGKRAKKKLEMEVEKAGISEKKGNSNDDSKKLFQRLWSEDDEIEILKGIIEYTTKKKADPVADLSAFHEFIKKNLHIDVSRTQLQDKIRRLKKKYENNAGKEKKGKERVFAKAHEQKAYDLSKKIWGKEKNGKEIAIESPKVNGTPVKRSLSKNLVAAMMPKADEGEEGVKGVTNSGGEPSVEGLKIWNFGTEPIGVEEWIMKNGMELIEGEKKEEMVEKWRKLREEEVEIYAKRLALMHEQTKLVLDVMKSSQH